MDEKFELRVENRERVKVSRYRRSRPSSDPQCGMDESPEAGVLASTRRPVAGLWENLFNLKFRAIFFSKTLLLNLKLLFSVKCSSASRDP